MARKTQRDRDLIDYPIAIRRTKSRARKIELLRGFEATYGGLPVELLEAFGSSEWHRGFDEGVADANGYDGED